jgi:Zn-finger nucleic acid-binding protein
MREGVEIDCCPQCGGIWLDHGELFSLFNKMINEMSIKHSQNQKIKNQSD